MFIWLIITLKQTFKIIYVLLEFELCNTRNYSIVFKIILTCHASKWFNSSGFHNGFHHNTHRPLRVLQLCDCTVHSSQLNVYKISIHVYLTIQHILNLSHTLNLNHNVIIPTEHIITPHESYKHHTILIFTWHKTCIY